MKTQLANQLQGHRRTVRAFVVAHWSDEDLAKGLAFAQDDKFGYYSCCCFIGLPTADHALVPSDLYKIANGTGVDGGHYNLAKSQWDDASFAETAFYNLGIAATVSLEEKLRRTRIIPILKAEIHRRERVYETARLTKNESEEVCEITLT